MEPNPFQRHVVRCPPWSFFALVTLLLAACTGPGRPPAGDTPARLEDLRREKPDSNLVITLINASSERPDIDFALSIDGQTRATGSLQAGSKFGIAFNERLHFVLRRGRHFILIRSEKGGAELEREISIRERSYLLVGYEYSPGPGPRTPAKQFHLVAQAGPFYFQ